jgi:flotillin
MFCSKAERICLIGTRFFCRRVTVEGAHAEAERIRLIGGSEAGAIECVGKAEAEKMRLKASAYKQYGEAAMLSLVLETLPKVRNRAAVDT